MKVIRFEICLFVIEVSSIKPVLQRKEDLREVPIYLLRLVRGHGHRLSGGKEDVEVKRAEVAPTFPDVNSVL